MATFIERFAATGPGLRVAVKDLIDLAGVPTTDGSKVIASRALPAEKDAACMAGTRAAERDGTATIVGKTNLHELAFGVTGINPWFGTPVNPIDPNLVPGGSSSGSAVAVGTGDADVAFGSDTGGSIRVPAACCGVVGLKTTRGRIPLAGVCPLSPSLDTVGPMAATVELATRGMALLEPGFAPAPDPAPLVGRVRLAAEPRIDRAIDAALAAAGLESVDVDLPEWQVATTATMTILMAEAWQVYANLWRVSADGLSPDVAARLEASSLITAEEVAACWEQARDWGRELAGAFERVPVLALPTLASAPPTLENAAHISQIRYVAPFNGAGVPALAMPVAEAGSGGGPGGGSGGGPPVGVAPASLQLVGPAGSEEVLLATAAIIEGVAGWRRDTGGTTGA